MEAVKSVARYTLTNDTTPQPLVFSYSSLVARLPWRFTPDSASGLLRVLVVLLFSLVSLEERTGGGGNRLVGMQGVHMYLLYCTLCMEGGYRDVHVCVILYMRDGYIMDT